MQVVQEEKINREAAQSFQDLIVWRKAHQLPKLLKLLRLGRTPCAPTLLNY
jgi:hypothetical protein